MYSNQIPLAFSCNTTHVVRFLQFKQEIGFVISSKKAETEIRYLHKCKYCQSDDHEYIQPLAFNKFFHRKFLLIVLKSVNALTPILKMRFMLMELTPP